jgi:hypothetical protein
MVRNIFKIKPGSHSRFVVTFTDNFWQVNPSRTITISLEIHVFITQLNVLLIKIITVLLLNASVVMFGQKLARFINLYHDNKTKF